jgi:ubiquinone/menaquinone biosynthesis C-methylase UbiE
MIGNCVAAALLAFAVSAQELPSPDKVREWDGRRDGWQKPDEVLRALSIEPGSRLADVGAGLGYFTAHLSRAAGAGGRVYAADVDERAVRFLKQRAASDGWGNVEVVQSAAGDPRLPRDAPLDAALIALTWHLMTEPEAVFRRLHAALRPGGRLVLLEPSSHDAAAAERQLRGCGFRILERIADFSPDGFRGAPHRLWLLVAAR